MNKILICPDKNYCSYSGSNSNSCRQETCQKYRYKTVADDNYSRSESLSEWSDRIEKETGNKPGFGHL